MLLLLFLSFESSPTNGHNNELEASVKVGDNKEKKDPGVHAKLMIIH